MSKVALKAQALVKSVVEPYLRPGDKIKRQRNLAGEIFRADEMPAGWSKINAAWKGRAGAPTYVALYEQAEKLGLLTDKSAYVARLRGTQELLYERYGTRDHPDIQALEWAIGIILGRPNG